MFFENHGMRLQLIVAHSCVVYAVKNWEKAGWYFNQLEGR